MSNVIEKHISGKIFDGLTSEPIKGVNITIEDLSEDKTYFPLPKIEKTNKNGEYSFSISYPDDIPPKFEDISIKLTKNGYGIQDLNIFKGNGDIIENVRIITLNPLQSDLDAEKIAFSLLTSSEILTLTSPFKDADFYAKKRLTDAINQIRADLTGKALDMLSKYGITDVQSIIDDPKSFTSVLQNVICIPKEEADLIISNKNKLVKILNKQYTLIETTTKYLGITDATLKIITPILKTLSILPIPVAIAGVGLPMSAILKVQATITKIEKLIDEKITPLTTEILTILIILQSSLATLIRILNLLDQIIQQCYPDADQEQISQELIDQTKEINELQNQTEDNNIYPEINGFILEVETERTERSLKRKRAIAKSKNGTILLRGEWSFSSIDRILVDELSFYIQQNNLKAN